MENNLKHLGFVRVIAINTIVWLSNVYENAKEKSGPLRSTVVTVENLVTPVYNKFNGLPDFLLGFLDHKIDMASSKFDEHAPPLVKQAITQLHGLVQKTTQVTKEVVHQAQVGGPLEAARYAANESKDVVLDQSLKVLSKLDRLPPFHTLAEMIAPTATHFSERYNELVSDLRGKGYTVFSYVPLVPIDEITKVFKQSKADNEGEAPAANVASQ